jgi:Collagen triple helix repeat (20 copies)
MSEDGSRPSVTYQGPRGPQGSQGSAGSQGNQGRAGNQGQAGEQGAQGKRGAQGEHGVAGLSRPVRRALVFLFVLCVALAAANMLWTAHAVNADNQQQCASLEAVARIPVPQPVAGNPSRLWDSRYEAIERQRARQLHCPGF